MSRRKKAINYIGNKELLKEIHKSKNSYCEFEDPIKHSDYDIIVSSIDEITPEIVAQAQENRAHKLNTIKGDELFANGQTNKQIEEYLETNAVQPESIAVADLVFRVITNEHVPLIKGKKGKIVKHPVNFPAFQHFVFRNQKLVCVGKSHWKDGKFSVDHGQVSRNLAMGYMKIVEKYSNRTNWRNYSWKEDMISQSLVRLAQVGLQFAEHKSNNPFAYFTTVITHSFTYVLIKEKENVNTRNKIIQESGYNPSFSEQADHAHNVYMRDRPQLVHSED